MQLYTIIEMCYIIYSRKVGKYMKKVIIIGIFILGLIIPSIDVKAVDVSNEEELRAAIEQGGDITLTRDIEITQPLVIDKDVNISGYYSIMMQGDNTLITVNSGNVTLTNVSLYAGWNGKYDEWGSPDNVVKGQGKALVVNDGTVNLEYAYIYAGNVGLEVNGGAVTGDVSIYAGERNEDNETYLGGQGIIANGGSITLNNSKIFSGETALTLNNNSVVNYIGEERYFDQYSGTFSSQNICIDSFNGNGAEVNDNAELNIANIEISSPNYALYLNGGTTTISGLVDIGSSNTGIGIYFNKGKNSADNKDILILKNDFIFGYSAYLSPNFSIEVNSNIDELKITDEKNFLNLNNNKLNLSFCSGGYVVVNQTDEEKRAICENLNANLDGPIESNELDKCTVVYINGVKQKDADASCNPVADNKNEPSQVVNVPATSAYASIIIILLGIVCVIVSVIVTRRVTKKNN